jgi:hypothetical protein
MTYGAGGYGLNHLGDTGCCCGVDRVRGFSGWFRGNFANVIRSARSERVRLGDLRKYWAPAASIRRIMNSRSRIKGDSQSMRAYMKRKWNELGTPNAITSFLGVTWQGELDEEGNRVYVKERISSCEEANEK